MIYQIKELNLPAYATLSTATVNLTDMGENTITAEVKIDGAIVPDFSYDWVVEFRGERYVHPLHKPQAYKDNTSLNSVLSLTFKHKAVVELQRYYFFTYASTKIGTAVADQYIAPLTLNLKNFCISFNEVLDYYFHGSIKIDLNPDWVYDSEPKTINISYSYLWDVLIQLYDLYGVRWRIVTVGNKYVIKVGYGADEIDHVFRYGFEGGLLKIERQVQDDNIRNIILGRGGEKNLPQYYFKKAPDDSTFPSDPDWIPELANIYFDSLRDSNFRDYVKGWKTNPRRDLQDGTLALETYDANYAAKHFAYELGATDEFFRPIEYVKDDKSISEYGELWGALDNNEEIYPSIQGVTVDPIGRVDEVIAVQEITSDDVEDAVESEAQLSDLKEKYVTVTVEPGKRVNFIIMGGEFTVPDGFNGVLYADVAVDKIYNKSYSKELSGNDIAGLAMVESHTIDIYNKSDNSVVSPANIPAGTYYYRITGTVVNNDTEALRVTVGATNGKVVFSNRKQKWGNTFDIWIKNIWLSEKLNDESDEQYVSRVWTPILGGRDGEEAKVVFSTGWLSTSEDYEFTIVKGGVHFEQKECKWTDSDGNEHTYTSEWRLTLEKSDAELDATGLYLPNTRINAHAGDFFFFIGIELPHQYILWAEERLNASKQDELGKVADIKPTWAVDLDKIRITREKIDPGEVVFLIEQIVPGASFKLADPRFIPDKAFETVYVQSMTFEFKEPTNNDPALIPDVSLVLSNEWANTASVVSTLQGSIDALTKQIGSISNIEQLVRVIGDSLYLRKDGISDISLSPTQFASLLTSLNFRQGLLGGQGWGFFKDEQGNWSLEVDRLNVRQEMSVNELVINQISARGGMYVESAANMEVTSVVINEVGDYACYFDQKGGSVSNLFKVGDVALCHRYTAENGELKFYKRRVLAVGVDHIVLSNTEKNGSGIPFAGDVIVQYGSYTEPSRRYVKVRDVIGGGYERYIEGLNSVYSTGTEYYFVGRQAGMYNNNPRFFIGNTQNFVEFVNGELNIKGKLNTLSTYDGKTLGDYINDAAQSAANDVKNELQAQIDGVIESFNGEGAPTLNNYPANEWTTDAERQRHDRDIYTDITPYVDDVTTPTSGQSWKWYYNSPTDYGWVKIADSEAVRALQLAQLSVTGVDVLYQQTNSATVAPDLPTISPTTGQITNLNGWSTTAPPWQDGMYMWQVTYTRKGDGSATFSAPTCISGADGQDGANYSPNLLKQTQSAIVSADTNNYAFTRYYFDPPIEVQPGDKFAFSVENIEVLDGNPTEFSVYLYNYEEVAGYGSSVVFTTANPHATLTVNKATTAHTIIVYAGKRGFTAGNKVRYDKVMLVKGDTPMPWAPSASEMIIPTFTEQYYLSTSNTELIGGTWQDAAPPWSVGHFIWTRTKIAYATGEVKYTDPVCATGAPGASGEDVYTLDLTNEVAGVACDATGMPIGTLPSAEIVVYKGASEDTGWSFQKTDNGCTSYFNWPSNFPTLSISSISADTATVTVQANKAGLPTLTATMNIYKVKPGQNGAQGYGVVASVSRPNFTEAQWNLYGTIGHNEAWINTSDIRNGCRVGDYFRVYGTATDTGKSHVAIYKSNTASGNLLGECVAHEIADAGADGEDAVVYALELSDSNISRNALGKLSTDTVTVWKYKTTGASARELTTEKTVRYQRIGYDASWQILSAATSSYSIPVPTSEALKAIVVELLDGTTVLDRERIPVLTDASDLELAGPNLLLNSTFLQGKYHWTFKGATIFPNINLNGISSVKIDSKNSNTDTYNGINQIVQNPEPGAYYAFSVYAYYVASSPTNGVTDIDKGSYAEIAYYAPDGRHQLSAKAVDLTKKGKWQRLTMIAQCPLNATSFQCMFYIVRNGTVWFACPQLTKGNQLSDFAPSPNDTDYIQSALRESGSIQGGLILASLIRLGYTAEDGEYKTTSGINGIGDNTEAIAVWGGGEMIDRAYSPASNAALFALRHNGTAYFAGNTVRFGENVMQIGDNLQLDNKGLSLNIGSKSALQVGDVAVSDTQTSVSQTVTLAGKSFGMGNTAMLYRNRVEDRIYPSGNASYKVNAVKCPAGSILSAAGTISWPKPNIAYTSDKFVTNVYLDIRINDTLFQSFAYILEEQSQGNTFSTPFSIGNLKIQTEAIVEFRLRFSNPLVQIGSLDGTQSTWEGVDGSPFTGATLTFTSGSLNYETGNQTTLGNNGLLASWGQSLFMCSGDGVVMRFGNTILRVDANGMRKSTDGGATWATL